jgi:Cdc6-like AAA superfamily ATPase
VENIHEENQIIKNTTNTLQTIFPEVQIAVSSLSNNAETQNYEKIMLWLSSLDFSAQQNDNLLRKEEGTGRWFLHADKFQSWLNGANMTLFCPGIPGAGKTMMATSTIDYLQRSILTDDVGLAYLYCNYKAQTEQTALNLLSAALRQLVHRRSGIGDPVVRLYNDHLKRSSRPTFSEIVQALHSVCHSYEKVYIIVDALDECQDSNGERSRLISELRRLQESVNMCLMCTARPNGNITEEFRSDTSLEVRASDSDVSRFVASRMPHLPRCIQRDDEMKALVQKRIVETADGM